MFISLELSLQVDNDLLSLILDLRVFQLRNTFLLFFFKYISHRLYVY